MRADSSDVLSSSGHAKTLEATGVSIEASLICADG